MRIVGGALRGRALAAPRGRCTRPTADRVRQALFDILIHAEWGGRAILDAATVLDAFAGTGAIGLEALSRGAANAIFMENDPAALLALRTNIEKCHAGDRSRVMRVNVFAAPPASAPVGVVFIDPPYGKDLLARAIARLTESGWIEPGSLIVAELGRSDTLTLSRAEPLADRTHGSARIAFWRA